MAALRMAFHLLRKKELCEIILRGVHVTLYCGVIWLRGKNTPLP